MSKAIDIARQLKASSDLLKRRVNTSPPKSKEIIGTEPKVLFFDIETTPTLGYVWRVFEDNLLKTVKEWYMLSFAAKWAHEDKVIVKGLCDYPKFSRDKSNDKALVTDLWKLLDEADVIIGHNGDAFDIKKSNARFIIHGLDPPATYKTIDTLKIARRHFKFNSNRLDEIGGLLSLGKKLQHHGQRLWFDCMDGDLPSWKLMKDYNAQDVLLLEKVYYRIRPWAITHPNFNVYSGNPDCKCPKCESGHIQRRGFEVKKTTKQQRFQCQDCGSWFTHGAPIKIDMKIKKFR